MYHLWLGIWPFPSLKQGCLVVGILSLLCGVSTSVPLQEALGKCAGSLSALEQGQREGRIIKTKIGGMVLYFFPQREYTRDHLFAQGLNADASKSSSGLDGIAEAQDSQLGFTWDPEKLIPEGLQNSWTGAFPMDGPSCTSPSPVVGSGVCLRALLKRNVLIRRCANIVCLGGWCAEL